MYAWHRERGHWTEHQPREKYGLGASPAPGWTVPAPAPDTEGREVLDSALGRVFRPFSFFPFTGTSAPLPRIAFVVLDLLADDTCFFADPEARPGVDVLFFRAGVRTRSFFSEVGSRLLTLERTIAAAAAAAARAGVRRGVGCPTVWPTLVVGFFKGVFGVAAFFFGVRDDLLFSTFRTASIWAVMKLQGSCFAESAKSDLQGDQRCSRWKRWRAREMRVAKSQRLALRFLKRIAAFKNRPMIVEDKIRPDRG